MSDRTSQMERLARYYLGYIATHLICLGVDSGLFAGLAAHEEGAEAKELAHELGFNARYVEHFLRAALALELLDHNPSTGRYRLASYMDTLLAEPENHSYMGKLAHLYIIASRDFKRMRELLKTGDTYTFQEHDEDFIEAVADSTTGIAGFIADTVVPSLPGLGGRGDVAALDLGCGAGGTVVALAKAFPRGRVVGVDVEPRSVEKANARIRAAGLEGRAEAQLAAAEDVSERGTFDLVTLVQVLHETRQQVRDTILARAHTALRPAGLLLIIDEPYPNDPSALREAPVAALMQFIEIFMGNVFLSPEDQKRMIEKTGFKVLSQTTPPPGLICVTIAQRS